MIFWVWLSSLNKVYFRICEIIRNNFKLKHNVCKLIYKPYCKSVTTCNLKYFNLS
jgi:hypothetical protein